MTKKKQANTEHNLVANQAYEGFVAAQKILKEVTIIAAAKGRIKDIKNVAKNDFGVLKGSIDQAVKEILKTEEKIQSDKEIESMAIDIIEVYIEETGQSTWLKPIAA